MESSCQKLVRPLPFRLSSEFYSRRLNSRHPVSDGTRFHQISLAASFRVFQNPSANGSWGPASCRTKLQAKEDVPSTSAQYSRMVGTVICMAHQLPNSGHSFAEEDDEKKLWRIVRQEAEQDAHAEPILASYLFSTILSNPSLVHSLSFHLSNKLSSPGLLSTTPLYNLFLDGFSCPDVRRAVVADLVAVRKRDPACTSYSHCLLNYKGFLALQTHRVSHLLWKQEKLNVAFALQSRISDVFAVDIHPGARIGTGILLDHATGVVIGETAVIGDNVSILHHVTLGGTGKQTGDRHPKVGNGVLIGAGAMILGNVKIGDGAKIGAGSVVLKDVPARCTAVGTPARLVEKDQKKIVHLPAETMDHTSFLAWTYVI